MCCVCNAKDCCRFSVARSVATTTWNTLNVMRRHSAEKVWVQTQNDVRDWIDWSPFFVLWGHVKVGWDGWICETFFLA